MRMVVRSVFLILSIVTVGILAINHFVLKENGKIIEKIDSPFYMREPNNLVAFLDQIKCNDFVETTYMELLRQRELMSEQLKFSLQFGEDLIDQAKCAVDYYIMEKKMTYLKIGKKYLKRLNLPTQYDGVSDIAVLSKQLEPLCQKYAHLDTGICCYDHLESFRPNALNLNIDNEDELGVGNFGLTTQALRRLSVEGLSNHPLSWKVHTMSSFYWRLRGHGQNALDCARRGVMLAPREMKDIPLLSLGTILFRAGRHQDAEVILSAAVEHAPEVSENHFALASTLAMTHDFNRSLHHFDIAERLDPSVMPRTLPVKNFISCLDNLTKKTAKMYSYVEYMKTEVKELKRLKLLIMQSHEKLMQQQVPLGARLFDTKSSSDDLLKRGQYCSTRTLGGTDEPVLFCDFYSDIQMRLESKAIDIESLERDLKLNSESLIKQVSTEFHKQLNFDKIKATKAQMPIATPVTTSTSNPTIARMNDQKGKEL